MDGSFLEFLISGRKKRMMKVVSAYQDLFFWFLLLYTSMNMYAILSYISYTSIDLFIFQLQVKVGAL